ncbi:MAG: hypothetical protein U9O83_05615 [Campylobacterota bacterium]|nr:hypothetical protein [Campylobacterota bacterium]
MRLQSYKTDMSQSLKTTSPLTLQIDFTSRINEHSEDKNKHLKAAEMETDMHEYLATLLQA